jgi:hypothetical protein
MILPSEIYLADFPEAGPHRVIIVSREDLNRGNYALVVVCTSTRFADYIEAANEQLLSVVGELDATIRQLGLHLRCQDAANLPAIHDVQIGLGRINFRLCLEKTARTAMAPAVEIQTAPASR